MSRWTIGLFATPVGIVVLSALDSTLFFSLPFGIDAAVILLAAQLQGHWWIVPLLATSGSLAGAALTFWMGRTVGEQGLDRWVSASRLESIRTRVRRRGAIALAALDLIPPPFPFTPFVLAAGALEVKTATFFVTLAVCRLLRFGAEAALGAMYGRSVIGWLDSDRFHAFVSCSIAAAVVLTAMSIAKLVKTSSRRAARPARAPAGRPHPPRLARRG